MILMRHPNLVCAYGASILSPGMDNQLEDLSGNGRHLGHIQGTQVTLSDDGGGVRFYSDTLIGSVFPNGTWMSKPHLWPGMTIIMEATSSGDGYDRWLCFSEGIWEARAQPCYFAYMFVYGGTRYMALAYNDWNPDMGLNSSAYFTPMTGRRWESIRADHTAGAQYMRTGVGDAYQTTPGDVVRQTMAGCQATSLLLPDGFWQPNGGTFVNTSTNDGLILHNLLIFDCCLSDADVERVRLGFAPIGHYPSPKPPNS